MAVRVRRADGAEIEADAARRITATEFPTMVDRLAEWAAGTHEIPPSVRKQLTADEAEDVA